MVQRHESGQAALAQRAEHATVVVEGRPAQLAGRGLDPRPLQRKPVRGVPQRGEQVEVLRVAVEVVDSVADADGRRARFVFKRPPVLVDVSAFNLMGGGRASPRGSPGGSPAWRAA